MGFFGLIYHLLYPKKHFSPQYIIDYYRFKNLIDIAMD